MSVSLEIKRKTIHSLGALSTLVIYFFGKQISVLFFVIVLMTLLVAADFRRNRKEYRNNPLFRVGFIDFVESFFHKTVKERQRKGESHMRGPILFYLGCLIVVVLFPELIAIISILVMSICDAVSALIGKTYGIHKLSINPRKSWEGSTAFFIACLLILYVFVDPIKALTTALIVSVVEMLPITDDNISVPLATGILLYLFI